jgi:hypothetical protein
MHFPGTPKLQVAIKVHKILLGSALFKFFEIKTIKETKKAIKPRLNVILEG